MGTDVATITYLRFYQGWIGLQVGVLLIVAWIGLGGCVIERNQCVPGTSASCACSDGSRGAQACDTDGTYGACDCGGCVPGTSVPCACAVGDLGAQICNAGGTYDACECHACVVGTAKVCTCEDGTPGAQTCMEDGQYGMCRCSRPLDDLRASVVGAWEGVATTPWVPPYPVHIEIDADGHYSGYCLDTECTAFYYGTDEDSPEK